MNIIKKYKKYLTTAILFLLLCITLVFFNNLNSGLNLNALALYENDKKDALNIPSDINFISDDKKSFIEFCKKQYGINHDIEIDNSTYIYYGSVNGYRFYRINISCMPVDSINHNEIIGGYNFSSSLMFRTYPSGLYIIGDNGVYTLTDAYNQNLIDITQIHELFLKK